MLCPPLWACLRGQLLSPVLSPSLSPIWPCPPPWACLRSCLPCCLFDLVWDAVSAFLGLSPPFSPTLSPSWSGTLGLSPSLCPVLSPSFHPQSENKKQKSQLHVRFLQLFGVYRGVLFWIVESRKVWHDCEIARYCNINVFVKSRIEVSYKMFINILLIFNF